MPPLHTFKIPGHFRGFSGLSIEVKFRKKGVFDVFWKNFHFCVYRLEVDGPYFYMGRKSELRFFSKSAEHVFGFGSDFVLLYSKIRPDENDDAYRLPRPVAQGVSSLRFCSDSRCEMASKKK
jgi:hypothetical protein